MCDLCRWEPCHPSCPNAKLQEAAEWCTKCGNGLYEGDECYEIDGKYICQECMDNLKIIL